MKLNALMMCREPQSARVLAAALDELKIQQEACVSSTEALQCLAQRYYSALIADFDVDMAAELVRLARMAPAQRRPVVFGVIGALTNVSTAFQSGTNFVFYKPLVVSQVLEPFGADGYSCDPTAGAHRVSNWRRSYTFGSGIYAPFQPSL